MLVAGWQAGSGNNGKAPAAGCPGLRRSNWLLPKNLRKSSPDSIQAICRSRASKRALSHYHLQDPPRILPLLASVVCALVFCVSSVTAAQVSVRHREGLVHGFLVLRTLEGETLANGDLVQNAHGDRV